MTWWRSWKTIRKSFRRNIQIMRSLTFKVGQISHVTPCWPRTSCWWGSRCSAGISLAQLLQVLTAFQEACQLATAFWRTIQSSWCRLEGQTKRSSVTWRSTTTSCAPTATRRFWGCARSSSSLKLKNGPPWQKTLYFRCLISTISAISFLIACMHRKRV